MASPTADRKRYFSNKRRAGIRQIRSAVEGSTELRRTLRSIEPEVREKIADALAAIGNRLALRAKADAPSKTGALRAGLSMRVARKSLTLKVGLVTKAAQRRLFYGYILEVGRRAKVVQARRQGGGKFKGSRFVRAGTIYPLRIRPIARSRYNFVFNRLRDFRSGEVDQLREAMGDALLEAAARG